MDKSKNLKWFIIIKIIKILCINSQFKIFPNKCSRCKKCLYGLNCSDLVQNIKIIFYLDLVK